MSQLTTYQERVVLGTQSMERYYISLETSPRLEPRKIKNILDAALHRMNFVFNTKARMCPKTSENESFPNKMLKKWQQFRSFIGAHTQNVADDLWPVATIAEIMDDPKKPQRLWRSYMP